MVLLHRRGVFEESFSFIEVKHVARIMVLMHCIDLLGHYAFRYYTQHTFNRLTKPDEEAYQMQQRKTMEQYLEQKNYFKSTKENKL